MQGRRQHLQVSAAIVTGIGVEEGCLLPQTKWASEVPICFRGCHYIMILQFFHRQVLTTVDEKGLHPASNQCRETHWGDLNYP